MEFKLNERYEDLVKCYKVLAKELKIKEDEWITKKEMHEKRLPKKEYD